MKINFSENANLNEIKNGKFVFDENLTGATCLLSAQKYLFSLCEENVVKASIGLSDSIKLLAHVCGLGFDGSDSEKPFKSMLSLGNGARSICLDDLTEKHIKILEDFEIFINNDLIKARIHDVLWCIKNPKDHKNALKAIKFYLNYSQSNRCIAFNSIADLRMILQRSFDICFMLGGKDETRKQIVNEVKENMFLTESEPECFSRFHFYKLLVKYRKNEDFEFLKETGEKLVNEAKEKNNFEKAKEYIKCLIEIHKKKSSSEKYEELRNEMADLSIEEARYMKNIGADPAVVQSFYNQAILICRKVKRKSKKDIQELIKELKSIQLNIPDSLKQISVSVDISNIVKKLKLELMGKNFKEGFKTLCSLPKPPSKKGLYDRGIERNRNFPVQALFASHLIDEKGKIIAKKPGLSDSEATQTAIKRSGATLELKHHFLLQARLIEIARQTLRSKSDYNEEFIESLLSPNLFVPESRFLQFKTGIMRGFEGDWISSSNILTPLLENSLRSILDHYGENMIQIDSEGIQKEKDLGSFIYSDSFKSIFGEDLAFYMQVLLVEKTGLNFRNNLAHGLCSDGMVTSDAPKVLWCLTLFFCKWFQEKYVEPSVNE